MLLARSHNESMRLPDAGHKMLKHRQVNNTAATRNISKSSFSSLWLFALVVIFPLIEASKNPALVEMLHRVQRRTGFQANAIIDVGANQGDWSREARKLFPEAKMLLLEATPHQENNLKEAVVELGQAEFRIAVLSSQDGQAVKFFQGKNTGNSMFRENSHFYQNEVPVERVTQTVDSIVADSLLQHKVIDVIKADVQGAELAVFQGATKALSQATFVYFEASTIEYNAGAPCFYEVDAYLRSLGFFLYDMADLNYNDAFKTFGVGQYDVMYIRPDSPRLPQLMREAGAKYCGHGKPLTTQLDQHRVGHNEITVHGTKALLDASSGYAVTQSIMNPMLDEYWMTWTSGFVFGITITLLANRFLHPKAKRSR